MDSVTIESASSSFFATAQDLQIVGIRMTATRAAASREILDDPHMRPTKSPPSVRADLKKANRVSAVPPWKSDGRRTGVTLPV